MLWDSLSHLKTISLPFLGGIFHHHHFFLILLSTIFCPAVSETELDTTNVAQIIEKAAPKILAVNLLQNLLVFSMILGSKAAWSIKILSVAFKLSILLLLVLKSFAFNVRNTFRNEEVAQSSLKGIWRKQHFS